jgi:hypothetical protein
MKKRFLSAFSLILLFVTSFDLYCNLRGGAAGRSRKSKSSAPAAIRSPKPIIITKKEEIIEKKVSLSPDGIIKVWQENGENDFTAIKLSDKEQKYSDRVFSEAFEYVFLSSLAAKAIEKSISVGVGDSNKQSKHDEIVEKNKKAFDSAMANQSAMYEATRAYLMAKLKDAVINISPVNAQALTTFKRGWMRTSDPNILFARLCRKHMNFIKYCINAKKDDDVFSQMRGGMAIYLSAMRVNSKNLRQDLILINELHHIVAVCTIPNVVEKNAKELLSIQNRRLDLVKKILEIKYNIIKSSSGTWGRVSKGFRYTLVGGAVLALAYYGAAKAIAKAEEKKWIQDRKMGEKMLQTPGKLISKVGEIARIFKDKAKASFIKGDERKLRELEARRSEVEHMINVGDDSEKNPKLVKEYKDLSTSINKIKANEKLRLKKIENKRKNELEKRENEWNKASNVQKIQDKIDMIKEKGKDMSADIIKELEQNKKYAQKGKYFDSAAATRQHRVD